MFTGGFIGRSKQRAAALVQAARAARLNAAPAPGANTAPIESDAAGKLARIAQILGTPPGDADSVVEALEELLLQVQAGNPESALTPEQMSICKRTNCDPAKFLAELNRGTPVIRSVAEAAAAQQEQKRELVSFSRTAAAVCRTEEGRASVLAELRRKGAM